MCRSLFFNKVAGQRLAISLIKSINVELKIKWNKDLKIKNANAKANVLSYLVSLKLGIALVAFLKIDFPTF